MAVLTGSFQSKELFRKVNFTAIIPTRTRSIYEPEDAEANSGQPLKTLYLLHGWDGNHEDWLQNTRIVELAIKHHVAVIMPDGQNSFYVDQTMEIILESLLGKNLFKKRVDCFSYPTKEKTPLSEDYRWAAMVR